MTKKLAVVLISHGFQSNYEKGFSNGLAKNDVSVTLISSDRTDYAALSNSIKCENLRGSQSEARTKYKKLLNLVAYHFKLLFYVCKNGGAVFHVIGLIDPPVLYGIFWGVILRFFSGKYILTVHDLLPHDRHTFLNKLFFKFSFLLPNHLVVHTQQMAISLQTNYNISLKKVTVMEHGIEPFSAEPVFINRPVEKPIRLLFFGKVARYKGLDLLLDALENVDENFHLMIAGSTVEVNLKDELLVHIKNHSKSNCITWLDSFIPEADLPGLFTSADMLVLPYRHIDQSGVLFQAFRYGLPVLATNVGSFKYYITESVGEICLPNDVYDLRDKLNVLMARVKFISRSQIKQSAKKYEWPVTVKPLVSLLGSFNNIG